MPSQEEYLDNLLKGLSDESISKQSASDEPISEEPVSEESISEELILEEPVSEESVSDEPISEEPVSEESVSDEPISEEPVSEESISEKPISEEPVSEEVISEELISEEPVSEEVILEESEAEETVTGESAADKPESEETVSEEVASGEQISEENTSELNLNEFKAEIMSELESDTTSEDSETEADDIDSLLSRVSEEDIEQILNSNNSEENFESVSSVKLSEDELADLLAIAGDDENVNDIHDMLQKSDNNEAVDDGIISLLEGTSNEGAQEPEAETPAEARARKAEEKRLKREEKKEARRIARENKKAEREAKKAERAAKKKKVDVSQDIGHDEERTWDSIDVDNISAEMDALLEGTMQDIAPADSEDNLADDSKTLENIPDSEKVVDISPYGVNNNFEEILSVEDADFAIKEKEEPEPKKKSFLAKLLEIFTEEDDEEDDEEHENEDIRLSDENRSIIDELDNADADVKKGKKAKKPKKEKKKKGKKGGNKEEAAGGDEIPEGEETEKGKKKKKAKKPKKEKAPKPVDDKPGKRLSKRRIILIALICASILVGIIIITNMTGEYTNKKEARQAFVKGDYQTCYQNLYGKKLNKSDKVMYCQSECILRIRLWFKEYEMFVEDGSEIEALDSLIQSVNEYPELYEYALQWNYGNEVSAIYNQMLQILSDKYGLTEEEAMDIAATKKDIEYTRKVVQVIEGGIGEAPETNNQPQTQSEPLKDVLPEEEGMVNSNFVDNM